MLFTADVKTGTSSSVQSGRRKKPYFLMLTLGIATGAAARLFPVLSVDFPLHDGGLFYEIVQDILHFGYAFPKYTVYNSVNIPFAYPPLSFYAAAFLTDVMRWPLIDVFRFLPTIFSILSIVAFYSLCHSILRSEPLSVFAVVAFSLLPRSFEWTIMGGGLTRSLGFLFAILTIRQVHLLYTHGEKRLVLSTILYGALTSLTHPDATWFTLYSVAILFLFYGRNRLSFYKSLIASVGVLAVTAPWWGIIYALHGFTPLLSAFHTDYHSWYSWIPLIFFDFSSEPYLPIMAIMGFLGMYACFVENEFFLPTWLATVLILDPRGAIGYTTVPPLAMLAAIGAVKVILPGMESLKRDRRLHRNGGEQPLNDSDAIWRGYFERPISKPILGMLLIYGTISAFGFPSSYESSLYTLPRQERDAMQWVASNTPESSRFVIVSSNRPGRDAASEWFPVLAQRTSLATFQGYEWLPDNQFYRHLSLYHALQNCANEDIACLDHWSTQSGSAFTHVYISRDCCLSLRRSLQASPHYESIYDGPGATIFVHESSLARKSRSDTYH